MIVRGPKRIYLYKAIYPKRSFEFFWKFNGFALKSCWIFVYNLHLNNAPSLVLIFCNDSWAEFCVIRLTHVTILLFYFKIVAYNSSLYSIMVNPIYQKYIEGHRRVRQIVHSHSELLESYWVSAWHNKKGYRKDHLSSKENPWKQTN